MGQALLVALYFKSAIVPTCPAFYPDGINWYSSLDLLQLIWHMPLNVIQLNDSVVTIMTRQVLGVQLAVLCSCMLKLSKLFFFSSKLTC